MEYELVGDFELGDGWQCECGKVFFLAGKVFENNWTSDLHFHCSKCGTKYTLCEGELRKQAKALEFAESPW